MPAIPNSLNSGGRRRYPGSTAGLGLDDQNMLLRPGAAPAGLPMLGGTGGTSLAVGPAAAFGRAPMMLPMLGGPQHSSGVVMPSLGGGYGGGGFPEHGGGGSPGFGGMGHQSSIDAHPYGDTVAPVNSGAAPYHGLDALDIANSEKPKLTSWGAEWTSPFESQRHSWEQPIAHHADGTDGHPAPPGVPVIIGDPQKDGKPNPELVLQTPQGLHIIPLKDMPEHMRGRVDGREIPTKPAPVPMTGLKKFYSDNPGTPTAAQVHMMNMMRHPEMPTYFPSAPLVHAAYGNEKPRKYAEGTGTLDPSRFNLTDEYVPGFVPRLDTGGAFGRTLPFSDGSGGIEARDVNNNVVGFSTDLPPMPTTVPHGTNAPPSLPSLETPEQYRARRLAMNPQQIDVGFTPRPALHGFADADALRSGGASREDRGNERMQREVMRAAHGNPYLAQRLLEEKAANEAAKARGEFEIQKHQDLLDHQAADLRRKQLAAAGMSEVNQGEEPRPTVARQRLEAEQARNAIVDQREAKRLGISEEQLAIQKDNARRAEEEVQRKLHPQAVNVEIPNTNFSAPYVNGQPVPKAPILQGAQSIPSFMVGNMPMPGSPPQLKPFTPPPKNPDPTGVKAVQDHIKQVETIGKILSESEQEDSKHKLDATTKARLQRLHDLHLSAYEKAMGIEPDPPVGMGDVHAAEGAGAGTAGGTTLERIKAARASMQ